MKKVAFHNLGCKVNAYETDAMQQLLENEGYEIVPFAEGADIYIINTCSVTNIADRKSRQMIHKARHMNPHALVVAAGCYVQTAQKQEEMQPYIDLVVGNNKKKDIVSLIKACEQKLKAVDEGRADENRWLNACLDINEKKVEYENLQISRTGRNTRAYVKIQDGCNQFCSYCIIPYARGRVRSRGRAEVLEECRRLAENGYREVVLTGIHLSSYGTDLDESRHTSLLIPLLESIHSIKGIERIRLSSLEPRIITEAFTKAISGLEKVCPHFHLSLQSGCNETLKRMNRHYTVEEYEQACQILRSYYVHPAITTDIITGFPGETEEEFQKTVEFVKKVNFYETHIFKYSKRQGTRAASMEHQLPESVKAERSRVLLELDKTNSRNFREYYMGKETELLIEEQLVSEGNVYQLGHTREYIKAVLKEEGDCSNTIVAGTIKGFFRDDILSVDKIFPKID